MLFRKRKKNVKKKELKKLTPTTFTYSHSHWSSCEFYRLLLSATGDRKPTVLVEERNVWKRQIRRSEGRGWKRHVRRKETCRRRKCEMFSFISTFSGKEFMPQFVGGCFSRCERVWTSAFEGHWMFVFRSAGWTREEGKAKGGKRGLSTADRRVPSSLLSKTSNPFGSLWFVLLSFLKCTEMFWSQEWFTGVLSMKWGVCKSDDAKVSVYFRWKTGVCPRCVANVRWKGFDCGRRARSERRLDPHSQSRGYFGNHSGCVTERVSRVHWSVALCQWCVLKMIYGILFINYMCFGKKRRGRRLFSCWKDRSKSIFFIFVGVYINVY